MSPPPPAPVTSRRILVVDDEEQAHTLIRDCLIPQFPEITLEHAYSARDLLRLIEKDEYDLVLLDVYLGQDDGLRYIGQIRNRQKTARIIVVTVESRIDYAVKRAIYGPDRWVVKDGDIIDCLPRVVRQELDIRSMCGSHVLRIVAPLRSERKLEYPTILAFESCRDPLSRREAAYLRAFVAAIPSYPRHFGPSDIAAELSLSAAALKRYLRECRLPAFRVLRAQVAAALAVVLKWKFPNESVEYLVSRNLGYSQRTICRIVQRQFGLRLPEVGRLRSLNWIISQGDVPIRFLHDHTDQERDRPLTVHVVVSD